jgi:hypothetical protein
MCERLVGANWREIRGLRYSPDARQPPDWRHHLRRGREPASHAPFGLAVFLYAIIATAQALQERLDWLCVDHDRFHPRRSYTTAFAARAPQFRFIAISDARATRIRGLVLL